MGFCDRLCDRDIYRRTAYRTESGGKREGDDTLTHGLVPLRERLRTPIMMRHENECNVIFWLLQLPMNSPSEENCSSLRQPTRIRTPADYALFTHTAPTSGA